MTGEGEPYSSAGVQDPARWALTSMSLVDAVSTMGMSIESRCSPPFIPAGPLPEDWERTVRVFDAVIQDREPRSDIASAHGITGAQVNSAVRTILTRYQTRSRAVALGRLADEGHGPSPERRHWQGETDDSWPWILGLVAENLPNDEISTRLGMSAVVLQDHYASMQRAFDCRPAPAALLRGGYSAGLCIPNTGSGANVDARARVLSLPPLDNLDPGLSPRIVSVLEGRSLWQTNAEVGKRLFVSTKTVKTHIARGIDKLGAEDAAGAFAKTVVLGHLSCGRSVYVRPGLLSDRELEAAQYVALGLSNAQIGRKMWVGKNTVKTHLENVFLKLSAPDRVTMVRRLFAANLLLVGSSASCQTG